MIPIELVAEAYAESPDSFNDDDCPPSANGINCEKCKYRNPSYDPTSHDTAYRCGIDPNYIKEHNVIDQLKLIIPEHFI